MSLLKLYFASNDTVISEPGELANAISLTLRADLEQTDSVRLYAKCDDGYQAQDTAVSLVDSGYRWQPGVGGAPGSVRAKDGGDPAADLTKWALAPDVTGSEGAYGALGAPLALGTVTALPMYFWAKGLATDDEVPVKDISVAPKVLGTVEAV